MILLWIIGAFSLYLSITLFSNSKSFFHETEAILISLIFCVCLCTIIIENRIKKSQYILRVIGLVIVAAIENNERSFSSGSFLKDLKGELHKSGDFGILPSSGPAKIVAIVVAIFIFLAIILFKNSPSIKF